MAKLSSDGTYVTVERGDTLSEIARDYGKGKTYKQLAAINGISNPNLIYVGQKIYLGSSSSGGSGGSAIACPLGKVVADGAVSESTLPYNISGAGAVVYNNEIHIFGGSGNYTAHYKYNGTNWVSVSTLPYPFTSGSAVVYNN